MNKSLALLKFLLIFLLFSFGSCSSQKEEKNILSDAENILEQQPDSALHLLNTILFPEELNQNMFNRYQLLLIQAKDKSDKDITSDTVIFAVKDYYVGKKDRRNAALAAFYCGRLWQERDSVKKAFDAYAEAEQLAKPTDDYNLKGLIQGNRGILHREHRSYENAIELLKNAVEMYDKAQNHKSTISALRIIGDCFLLNNNTDSAFYYYNESLKQADLYNLPKLKSGVKQSIGVACREQCLYGQAKKLFNEALAFPDDSVEQARILLNLAQVYAIEDNIDSVNIYLDKATELKINDPQLLLSSNLLMFEMARKQNRYQDALHYYQEYHRYTMEVFDSEKNNALLEIQGKYDFEKLRTSKKDSDIKFLAASIGLSGAIIVIEIIIFLFYLKSRQNKRLLLKIEQNYESMQKMSDDYSKEKERNREIEENYSKEHIAFNQLLLEKFDIVTKTALLKSTLSESEQKSGHRLLKRFNEIVHGKDSLDWNTLYQIIDTIKDGLYRQIRNKYPQMSEQEFRIGCLSCETDFDDNQIAIILGTTINMVRRIRSDLRKKLGMTRGKGFIEFFKEQF